MPLIGQLKLLPYSFAPRGYADCNGQLLPIAQNTALFSILGTTYGGDGRTTFGLPDLQGRAPVHHAPATPIGQKGGAAEVALSVETMPSHSHPVMATDAPATQATAAGNVLASQAARGPENYAPAGQTVDMNEHALTETGGGQAHDNMQPSLALRFVVATDGLYPSRNGGGAADDTEPFVGEIRAFGFNFAPRGWALCDGQLLAIQQYQALYSLLGTAFGGDGRTTFALPDLRGRTAIGIDSVHALGAKAGSETVALTADQIPAHDHQTELAEGNASEGAAAGHMLASGASLYNSGAYDTELAAEAVGAPTPNGLAHDNMMPFQTVNFSICLNGIYPSRN